MDTTLSVGFVLSLLAVLQGQTLLHTFNGDAPEDNLGYFVAGAGDLNGDAAPDLIVGTPLVSVMGNGYAQVFAGERDFGLVAPAVAPIGTQITYTLRARSPQQGPCMCLMSPSPETRPGFPWGQWPVEHR